MQMGPGQGQNGGAGWRVRNVTGTAGDVQVGVLDRPVRLEPVLVQPGRQHHEGGRTLWKGRRFSVNKIFCMYFRQEEN